MWVFLEALSSLDRALQDSKKLSDITCRIKSCKGRCYRLVVHFNCLKPCAEGMRFEESVDPPTVTSSQMSQLPVNSPVINDDCFDDTHVLLENNAVPASDDGNAPATMLQHMRIVQRTMM